MAINQDLLKNDVPAAHQVSEVTKVYDSTPGAERVLFLGNSITLHEPSPTIGWNNSWGMAASAEANDYVHIVLRGIMERKGSVNYCIANVSGWARNYEDDTFIENFSAASDFKADTVIVRFGENVDRKTWNPDRYRVKLAAFLDRMIPSGAKIIVTDQFWEESVMDGILRDEAVKRGGAFVKISDLGYGDENKAIGLFEHAGVASHPGDLGMKRIADRILAAYDAFPEKR